MTTERHFVVIAAERELSAECLVRRERFGFRNGLGVDILAVAALTRAAIFAAAFSTAQCRALGTVDTDIATQHLAWVNIECETETIGTTEETGGCGSGSERRIDRDRGRIQHAITALATAAIGSTAIEALETGPRGTAQDHIATEQVAGMDVERETEAVWATLGGCAGRRNRCNRGNRSNRGC